MPTDSLFDLAEVDRLLTTTKAVRRRLDLERPVERTVVLECINLALYAPNASNAQDWYWVVVDDPELRARVAEVYRDCVAPRSAAMLRTKLADGDEAGARISRSVLWLAESMADVPVLVLPCYDVAGAAKRYDHLLGDGAREPVMEPAMYASILPSVWSFQLALRSRGLGSTLTTAHQFEQAAVADILGIPRSWFQVALLPVAYTVGSDFTPSPRGPVEDVVVWNREWSPR